MMRSDNGHRALSEFVRNHMRDLAVMWKIFCIFSHNRLGATTCRRIRKNCNWLQYEQAFDRIMSAKRVDSLAPASIAYFLVDACEINALWNFS